MYNTFLFNFQFPIFECKALKEKHVNFSFCPMSCHLVLSMIRAGAIGNTATEMDVGLKYPENPQALADGNKEILESYRVS